MKKIKLIIILFAVSIITSACINVKSNQDTSGIDGGVFKSIDKGTTWQQKVLIPSASGKPLSFASVNVVSLDFDPSDNMALYFGSIGKGLIYTYDGGDNWFQAPGLKNMSIYSVAVDPQSKCIIYATIGNRIFKTTDCSRNWSQIYFDNDVAATIDASAVDHYDSNIIYAGISRGDLIKSADGGESWQTIYRFSDRIRKILIDPTDSRTMYVVTVRRGIFRTIDQGATWTDFNDVLNELKLGLNIKDILLVRDEPDTIFIATNYGLLKSTDRGENWEQISLIPPEKQASINAVAVNPQNSQEIYYVTNTTFFRSLDGGENWATIRYPSTRAGWKLLVDPETPNIIYMAMRGFEK